MANELGKRYTCEKCGSSVLCTKGGEGAILCSVLCTKGGEGAILCCEAEMELQEARKLPSSD